MIRVICSYAQIRLGFVMKEEMEFSKAGRSGHGILKLLIKVMQLLNIN